MQDDVTAAREMLRAEMAEDHLDLDLCEDDTPDTIAAALRAIALAIHKTREQCAKVAMETQYGSFAAAAIRAMGK